MSKPIINSTQRLSLLILNYFFDEVRKEKKKHENHPEVTAAITKAIAKYKMRLSIRKRIANLSKPFSSSGA